MIEGISEIKNIFRRCCKLTEGKIRLAWWSSNKVDESKSVRLLGLCIMRGENAEKKVDWSSVNFEDVTPSGNCMGLMESRLTSSGKV